jgi:hypothetical protein
MKDDGFSNTQISKGRGKSRTTIIKYLGAIGTSGICLKELLELKGEDLSELFEASNALNPINRKQIYKDLYSFFPYHEKEL